MLHTNLLHGKLLRTKLTPIAAPKVVEQTTGQIAKLWSRTRGAVVTPEEGKEREVNTDALARLRDLAEDKTEQVPVVKRPPVPRFIEYRRAGDNPLTLLYGAALASIDQLGRLPDALYLSYALVAEMRRAARRANIAIGENYKFFTGTGLVSVPIRTANDLPPILRLAMNGSIPNDSIIAVCS